MKANTSDSEALSHITVVNALLAMMFKNMDTGSYNRNLVKDIVINLCIYCLTLRSVPGIVTRTPLY